MPIIRPSLSEVEKHAFLRKVFEACRNAGVVWPKAWAAEAALESDWGRSRCAVKANNYWGQKTGFSSKEFPYIDISTDEVVHGHVEHLDHTMWPMFPSIDVCAMERMELLRRLAPKFPHYAAALNAQCDEDFILEVSKSWATDPERGPNCVLVFRTHFVKENCLAEANV